MHIIQTTSLIVGRFLLGLYFIVPGIQKITDFERMSAYMQTHDVPFVPFLLPLTIFIQLICGVALMVGYKGRAAAFLLAGLTLVISIYMHNFWGIEEGITRNHEAQNFIKNMAIMAGLLMVVAHGTGEFSIENQVKRTKSTKYG
jgi:putative oxidoreductase